MDRIAEACRRMDLTPAMEDSYRAVFAKCADWYRPDNNLDASPVELAGSDDFNRLAPELNELTESPDACKVIEAIVDLDSVVELAAGHAPSMVTALAKLGQRS